MNIYTVNADCDYCAHVATCMSFQFTKVVKEKFYCVKFV